MSDFDAILTRCRETHDIDGLIEHIPYSHMIGLKCLQMGEELIFHLPASESNLGNPFLPAIHGGVVCGFMELSAALHIMLLGDSNQVPKIVDFSIDFLRAGRHKDSYVSCEMVRQGRTVVNVAVTAWQDRRDNPIATARCHFLHG